VDFFVAQAGIQVEEEHAALNDHLVIGWPDVLQMVVVDHIESVSKEEKMLLMKLYIINIGNKLTCFPPAYSLLWHPNSAEM